MTTDPKDGIPLVTSPEEEGMNFEPNHLKGSGTIRRDGTYGPPEPDPTLRRGLGPDKTSGGRKVSNLDPDAPALDVNGNVTTVEEAQKSAEKQSAASEQAKPAKATRNS